MKAARSPPSDFVALRAQLAAAERLVEELREDVAARDRMLGEAERQAREREEALELAQKRAAGAARGLAEARGRIAALGYDCDRLTETALAQADVIRELVGYRLSRRRRRGGAGVNRSDRRAPRAAPHPAGKAGCVLPFHGRRGAYVSLLPPAGEGGAKRRMRGSR